MTRSSPLSRTWPTRTTRGMKICGDAYDSKHAEMLIHKGRAEDAEKALKEMAKASEDKGADEPSTRTTTRTRSPTRRRPATAS